MAGAHPNMPRTIRLVRGELTRTLGEQQMHPEISRISSSMLRGIASNSYSGCGTAAFSGRKGENSHEKKKSSCSLESKLRSLQNLNG